MTCYIGIHTLLISIAEKTPDVACVATGQCVTNAECDTSGTSTCVCNAGYTATPTAAPIMCKFILQ